MPANRRVLELIGQAFDAGPQGGANPFFVTSFAPDVVRVHADADPDLAADLLIRAVGILLSDAAAAQQNQTAEGFFAHAIDGIESRLLIRREPPPSALRQAAVGVLQQLAASAMTIPAQRARAVLGRLSEEAPPPPLPEPVPAARRRIGAVVLGIGVLTVGGFAMLMGGISASASAWNRMYASEVSGNRGRRRRTSAATF